MPTRTAKETASRRLVQKQKHKKSQCGRTPKGIRPHRLTLQRTPRQDRVVLHLVIRQFHWKVAIKSAALLPALLFYAAKGQSQWDSVRRCDSDVSGPGGGHGRPGRRLRRPRPKRQQATVGGGASGRRGTTVDHARRSGRFWRWPTGSGQLAVRGGSSRCRGVIGNGTR